MSNRKLGKNYKKTGGKYCPVCDNLIDEYENKGAAEKIPNLNGGFMLSMYRRKVNCPTCFSSWYEEWEISEITQLVKGTASGKKERKTKKKM